MLRAVLAALMGNTGVSGTDLRQSLGISREMHEQILTQLVRLGYLEAAPIAQTSCDSGGCSGCPVSCASTPGLGPQHFRLTERGRAYATRRTGA